MAPANRPVNNALYETLGERWYQASDDPVALLRAEARARNPWVASELSDHLGAGSRVLDVGCGAGFLSNHLARQGFRVTGVDASASSLEVAARYDETRSVRYDLGDAEALEYGSGSFDAVCAMDFLEHVERPEQVIAEAARVLRPGGLFFFHTFDRNPLAWLVVIKGVEWVVKNTPPDLHVLRLFIRPGELRRYCARHELSVQTIRGMRPALWSRAFLELLATGAVPEDLRFVFGRSTLLAYTGYARRA